MALPLCALQHNPRRQGNTRDQRVSAVAPRGVPGRYGWLRSTCSKKVLASKALAGAETLVMTERAIRADTMVFMAISPGDSGSTTLPVIDEQDHRSSPMHRVFRREHFETIA